nr:polysaccharide biosynthesis C-terminal domain-containing protein [Propioniciclava soli]
MWYAASQFVPFLGTAALSVVAGRMLGAERLGLQSLIAYMEAALFAVIVQSATTSCIRALGDRYGAEDEAGQIAMSWWTIRFHLVVGAFGGLLLFGYSLLRHDGELSWGLAAVSILATSAGWAWGAIIVAARGWKAIGQRRLVSQLAAAVLAIGAILLGGGIEWIFAANIVASLWLAWTLRRASRGIPRARSYRPTARFWPFYGMAALSQLIAQVAVQRSEFLVLDWFSSKDEIAMYSIAFMLVTVAVSIPAALTSAVMPEIARAAAAGHLDRLRDNLARALRVMLQGGVVMALGVAALGLDAVVIVYGEQFRRAGELTVLSALGLLAVPAWQLCSDYWTGRGMLRPVLVTGAFSGAVGIAVAIVLAPHFGAAGAVAAKLVSQFLMAVLLVGYTWHAHGRLRFLTWGWVRLLAACTTTGIVAHYLVVGMSPVVGLLVAAVVVAVGLAVSLLVLRPLEVEDAEWLAAILPSRMGPLLLRFASRAPMP